MASPIGARVAKRANFVSLSVSSRNKRSRSKAASLASDCRRSTSSRRMTAES
jgi:hypothetical protein